LEIVFSHREASRITGESSIGRARLSRAGGSSAPTLDGISCPRTLNHRATERAIHLVRGAGQRLADRFALPAGAPTPDRFGRENHKRDPDESESDEMGAGEWFVVEKNAQEETAARRKVLEKAQGREAEMARGVAKPYERQAGPIPVLMRSKAIGQPAEVKAEFPARCKYKR
jgi:hypothetical protein